MSLHNLLLPGLILPKVECDSKNQLISILADKIYDSDVSLPVSKSNLIKIIHAREEVGGTLLPSGLSVPHARLKDYNDFVIAIGIPARPVFSEGLQIRMMALMVSSNTGGPHYLKSLAELTKISRNKDEFFRLCSAESPEEILKILAEENMDNLNSEDD